MQCEQRIGRNSDHGIGDLPVQFLRDDQAEWRIVFLSAAKCLHAAPVLCIQTACVFHLDGNPLHADRKHVIDLGLVATLGKPADVESGNTLEVKPDDALDDKPGERRNSLIRIRSLTWQDRGLFLKPGFAHEMVAETQLGRMRLSF
jgi:hypothetical protein